MENSLAMRHKLVAELLEGRESLARMRILIDQQQPVVEDDRESMRELARRISESFTNSLSELSSGSAVHDGEGGSGSGSSSASSEELGKKAAAGVFKDHRGCHKRRKGAFSWIKVSPTDEDGYAWRKYGQKNIMNEKYPRCYFRCTYKSQGCKALRQVQRMEHDPHLYHITYIDHHTCQLAPVDLAIDLDHGSSMLDFEAHSSLNPESDRTKSTRISFDGENFLDEKSGKDLSTVGLEFLGHETIWASPSYREDDAFGVPSPPSYGFEGLDMEVNQFDDIAGFFD